MTFQSIAINELLHNLDYSFANYDLLHLALTHSSWANESKSGQHNERLEFLGDAVLELCISAELYKCFPDAREGDLTRLRAQLVNAQSLADIARSIGLPAAIKVGVGEERQGGRHRDSVLSDALEALLAAIYEDSGFASAQRVIQHLFKKTWPETWQKPANLDFKSRLQTISQHRFHDLPVYSLTNACGPEHAKTFEVNLRLPDGREFNASSSSCKKAEQKAAEMALNELLNDSL